MTYITLLICAFGTCFNPNQITYMESLRISSDCKVYFTGSNSYFITIEDHSCEEVSEEINKQMLEKSRR